MDSDKSTESHTSNPPARERPQPGRSRRPTMQKPEKKDAAYSNKELKPRGGGRGDYERK